MARDKPIAVHAVSGAFWTVMFVLAHTDKQWRKKNVRAIMFDSCPPKPDERAFAGWMAWFLRVKLGLPPRLTKPILAPCFLPVLPIAGINAEWNAQNDKWVRGDGCVIPRSTACLFVRGRNDPVLEAEFVDDWAAYLQARTTSHVESRLFEKAQHAMAMVEAPGPNKAHHVNDLLSLVPEWRGD